MGILNNFEGVKADLEALYHEIKPNENGRVASYIPQLAHVDPDKFAISLCTVDGLRFDIGDTQDAFCLQSVSKPITYAMVLEALGVEKVHEHVGREPSGHGFNEITLSRSGLPHNPMINAGAIVCNSLIKPDEGLAERFDAVRSMWRRLIGNKKVGYNDAVYLSEKETGDRNYALAHFMREMGAFPKGTYIKDVLNLYFKSCALELTTPDLATVAATLANGGICPETGEDILSSETVKHTLSLMLSCGMYDFSGEFAFTVGLPAKSGVSGVIMLVVPNIMGIAIYSPRIDPLGNSVRGLEFCKRLPEKYKLHHFDSLLRTDSDRIDPRADTAS